MQNAFNFDQLLAATAAHGITFEHVHAEPVMLSSAVSPRELALSQVSERYVRHGFAVVEFEAEPPTPETLVALGDALDLGEPFTPPLYATGDYTAAAVSRISTEGSAEPVHPSFERAIGLEMHCDGTLQKIGYVKTSILLCESPGAEGGDTTLFNACAAFSKLAATDWAAATALASPGALVRQANINGCRDINTGPGFTVQDGELVCAYSVTPTDSWVAGDGVAEADLRRGIDFMRRATKSGSPYFFQLRLAAGQAIVLANSRIAHGRTPYRDTEGIRRCLYRGLYLRQPRLMSGRVYVREAKVEEATP